MQRADYLFCVVFKPQLDSSFIIYAETFDSSTLMQQCQQKTQDNETMYRLNYHNISLYVVFSYHQILANIQPELMYSDLNWASGK